MIFQRTIKTRVSTTGVGLHKGEKVHLVLQPAAANTGIIFRRVDLDPVVDFPVSPHAVTDTRMCTCMTNEAGVAISTVEHLMSALAGLGIDNLIVELDANEVPIVDGSASPFIFLIEEAGIEELNVPKRFIKINEPIRVELGDKWAEIKPYNGFKLDFAIDFPHPAISATKQHIEFDFASDSYLQEISRARTFGFMKDFEYLRSINLALGGSFDNAVVLDEYQVLNPNGLRYDNEFLMHKILDAIGDMYMTSYQILGEMSSFKSGHELNNLLLRAIMENSNSWSWAEYKDKQSAPVDFIAANAM